MESEVGNFQASLLSYYVGTGPASYPLTTGALSQGVKQPYHEADH
jgi:hypothetical protein